MIHPIATPVYLIFNTGESAVAHQVHPILPEAATPASCYGSWQYSPDL